MEFQFYDLCKPNLKKMMGVFLSFLLHKMCIGSNKRTSLLQVLNSVKPYLDSCFAKKDSQFQLSIFYRDILKLYDRS